MTTYKYPTAFKLWGDEEHDAIKRVVASDQLTMGPETEAFEQELAEFNQRKHAVCCNSGSSANLLAVAAMILNDGKPPQVKVPALAWATTYSPFVQYEITNLQLVDCDETWCTGRSAWSSPNFSVECSILGNPSDVRLLEFSDLNDNCEAMGAEIAGKPVGAYGRIATLSFFHSHQLSAVEGGCVLTDDDELARLCRVLRDHGATRSIQKATKFEDEYNFVAFGYNLRTTEIYSAIGREQLRKMALFRTARRQNWYHFKKLTEGLPITMPAENGIINPFGIHFTLNDEKKRTPLVAALRAAGVDCRLPTGGSFRLHQYGRLWADQSTPNADRIHRAGLFIGNAPYAIPELIELAVGVMKEVLE